MYSYYDSPPQNMYFITNDIFCSTNPYVIWGKKRWKRNRSNIKFNLSFLRKKKKEKDSQKGFLPIQHILKVDCCKQLWFPEKRYILLKLCFLTENGLNYVFLHGNMSYPICKPQLSTGDSQVCLDIYGIIYSYSIMVRNILTSSFRCSSTGSRQLTNEKLELVCSYS